MGTFVYGTTGQELAIDDRTLAHLRAVITTKLRRRESFIFTVPDADRANEAVTFWMDPSIPIMFRIAEGHADERLNRMWLLELTDAANRPAGLQITEEPTVDSTAGRPLADTGVHQVGPPS